MRPTFFCFAVSIAIAAPVIAQAQDGSVAGIFEKYQMLGTFAEDCNRPASRDNPYYVHRVVDANHVQRDVMEGPTTRARFTMVDKAVALGPNEVSTSGPLSGLIGSTSFDRTPSDSIWRIEPNRIRFTEAIVAGRKVAADGRYLSNGRETPWFNRCGGT